MKRASVTKPEALFIENNKPFYINAIEKNFGQS